MNFRPKFPAPSFYNFIAAVVLCIILFQKSNAQTARTDPSEVRALNSLFQQWDVQIPRNLWNISGEPCTGTALGPDFDVDYNNPSIECNCTFNSNTTCHITKLWELVPQPTDAPVIQSMWLLKHKFHAEGSLECHKAHLVVNGKSQTVGIDCDDTFSPVVKPPTIRTVLSLAVSKLWPIHQLDVKNAFPHDNLKETVFMFQPPGFRSSAHPDYVCKLKKSLYGLKQAPRAWKVTQLNRQGVIPEELAALTYLAVLKIDQNAFTGTLPAFLGNFSAMVVLSVAHNAFFGPIPRELGNLNELAMLALSSNNFSGSLPRELGNLVNLQQLYLDSCGLGGEIPPTFANLRELRVMWAPDSPFSGNIPAFIGNWTKLVQLRLYGNNFEGPIPASFSNLTSLTSLRVSDLRNVSSSLDFIISLRNLTDLVLRNALISGPIPTDIIQLQNLRTLDLSFNNLTGPIPQTIMNMSSLVTLFLGNNSLSGSLLPDKSANLQNIDLSYNELSGRFPRWVIPTWSMPNLQLNLVANNFRFDSTNISIFPGLVCLQRDFPCNRNTTPYSSFAIKCGGSEIRSANGILFENDNSTAIGPASYDLVEDKWAVSNVGIVIDRGDPSFVTTSRTQVDNTRYPELFRTSRTSPGSLRYYGLGLQNGPYTISLFFAETVFNRSRQTWQGHGRRVFDIYIQGNLQEKDFDISKEAGGVGRAFVKDIDATVRQNYLEIHLFWAGKGTCCIPEQGSFGPLISAIRVSPGFRVRRNSKNKTGMIAGIVAGIACASLVFLAIGLYYLKKKSSNNGEEEDFPGMRSKVNIYSYAELKTATSDFEASNLLGEGGFGPVYKGTLSDGRVVAVKQLSVASHHGKNQFIAEISTISAVQHWNLVKLYGSCIEGKRRLLVYEYLENKSLDQALFGKNGTRLDWPTRFNICLGTARGLAYLHEESRPRIVHRDVKASNILLDAELCPKISDFGLAKLYDDKKTHISTRVAGTIGYLAPEYAMRGHLTSKADVFGFGVVCLEILSGRPNYEEKLDPKQKYLLQWAWSLYENNQSLELIDQNLTTYDEQQATRMMGVALMCVQASPSLRPAMSRVVAMLSGDIEVSAVTTKPSYLTDWDFNDTTNACFEDDEPFTPQTTTTTTTTTTTSTGVESMISPIILSEIMNNGSIREGR